MIKLRRIAAVGVCVFMLGCGSNTAPEPVPAPAPEPEPAVAHSISDYFPITENSLYNYTGAGDAGVGAEALNQRMFNLYADDTGVQVLVDNSEYYLTDVYRIEEGKLKLLYSGMNHYYDNMLNTADLQDIVMLQEPLELGTIWDYDDAGTVSEITAVDVKIQVPYGEFDALEVTTNYSEILIQKSYYALGVGLIKVSYSLEGEEVSMELSEVVNNTNMEMEVDFYVANITTDRQELEKRGISLSAGIDLLDYFNSELRKVASDDYQPLLPGDSEILALSLNRNEGSITVNLSANYVENLDSGAGIESFALQSLANTLGNFYNVDKVEILLEGSNYESGHISRRQGEYWQVEGPEVIS